MSIWLTRRNKVQGSGGQDPVQMVRGLVMGRLLLEHAYNVLIGEAGKFFAIWG
uniref:Uncharacterized protein n=1 Tax=Anguilla anguilla TaxID=7936 RepID=A0A0E9WBD4_ANGAN